MLTFVRLNCDLYSDVLRILQPLKSAERWADVIEPRRREYQTSVFAAAFIAD